MTTQDQTATTRLWTEYKSTADRAVRDQLIVLYSPLVKFVAGRVAVGLPQHVEHADLVSYGVFGLIHAIERFDPVRQVKFETYAIPRIKGAIFDELRRNDWVPRLLRTKAKALEQAHSSLEAQLLRAPTDAELAAELGWTGGELSETLRQMSLLGVAALDEVFVNGGDRTERTTLGDTIPDSTAGPVAVFEDKESKEILAKAIAQLGDREKKVLSLYYYEGLTLAEIGEILGVTESRVCQIHTKAVLQLRTRLSDRRMEGAQALAHGAGRPRRSGVRSGADR